MGTGVAEGAGEGGGEGEVEVEAGLDFFSCSSSCCSCWCSRGEAGVRGEACCVAGRSCDWCWRRLSRTACCSSSAIESSAMRIVSRLHFIASFSESSSDCGDRPEEPREFAWECFEAGEEEEAGKDADDVEDCAVMLFT